MARKASNNNFQIDKTPCAQVISGAVDHANCLGQADDKAQSTTKANDVPALPNAAEVESVQGEVAEPEVIVQGTNQETKEEEMATQDKVVEERHHSTEVQAATREEQTLVASAQNESTLLPTKSQKSEAGISITVPMKYYRQISFLKIRTGIPIRDLALRAVIEFLERNKLED
ncbi:MAG: hypothetical protein JJO71_10205 [Escherichia coli]|nr:hypothetical protein [Escherichia coli]MBL0989731.1 hypothetical protein [Escherichia coli]MBL0999218.1 hypothetical protein [Escherichia coli]MBL1004026.1 hypothetical protein [Escherichia coli]